MARHASCWMCRASMRWVGARRRAFRRAFARPTRRRKSSSRHRDCARMALAVADQAKDAEAEQRHGSTDPEIRSDAPADVDPGLALRDGDGEQAVVASWTLSDRGPVA